MEFALHISLCHAHLALMVKTDSDSTGFYKDSAAFSSGAYFMIILLPFYS
jgi:hypothetical protein